MLTYSAGGPRTFTREPLLLWSRPTAMTPTFRMTAAGLAAGALLAACGTATAVPDSVPATTAKPVSHSVGIRPTGSANCGALTLDLATGYKGYSTEAKAITAFVVSGTASFPLPMTGWATVDHRTYTSGTAHLKLRHIPHAGYAVTEASSC